MTTLQHPASLAPALRPRGAARNIRSFATRELREAVGNKWFVLYTLCFAALAVAMSFLSLAGLGAYGLAGFGRTAAGLVNLIMLMVPLMALIVGATSVSGERERGMLVYLLAQPVSRFEVLLGKFLGLGVALVASLLLGFGLSALLMAAKSGGVDAGAFAALVVYACLLALAMLSMGLLISVLSRRAAMAAAVALFVWLVLAFVSDLGLMAGTLVFKLRVESLFAAAVVNPLQAFKFAVIERLHGSLDLLGPAGLYASQTYEGRLGAILAAVLLAWIGAPLALAAAIFSRRSPL